MITATTPDLDRLLARRHHQISLNLLHIAPGPSGEDAARSGEPGQAPSPGKALALRYEQFGLQPPRVIHHAAAPPPAERSVPRPAGAQD